MNYYLEELELMKKILDSNNPRIATNMNNIACTLHNLNRLEESFKYHTEALQLRKDIFGEEHPETVSSLNNIASNLFNVGKLKEALETF